MQQEQYFEEQERRATRETRWIRPGLRMSVTAVEGWDVCSGAALLVHSCFS